MGDYFWVRLKPEWQPKGWWIALRHNHSFEGRTYQWELFTPGSGSFHAYDHAVEKIGPWISFPEERKSEKQ